MKIKANTNFTGVDDYLFSHINNKVNEYLKDHKDAKIIRLGIGDVTKPLPKIVVDAMIKAANEMGVENTFRGYPPEHGYTFLKEAIRDYYKNFKVDLDLDTIFVSDGAKSDLGNILDILGDNKAYIPNPVYPVYLESNEMSGRTIEYVYGNEENHFVPLPSDSMSTGIIYLCSPNNPTGSVYSYEGLTKWVEFARKTGSLIIFDAAYEAFIVGDYPHSIYEIEGAKECAIEICSFSKQAGFTGVRCGYSIVPKELDANGYSLYKLWKRRQATKFNGVSYITQRAAEAALSEEGIKACQENIKYYRRNALLIKEVLDKKNIWHTGGDNSPYIWLKCPNNMKSWDFFDYLLDKANIVGTPGEGFGTSGTYFFRLTAFGSYENTIEACKRLEELL
ncbi:MAG: LL-diaminopimelate aminotransferase [Acholeplasmatales bacterium]|nr:LL-diaminopimelate aminotransferase [Acholeplasmatales bacterium]